MLIPLRIASFRDYTRTLPVKGGKVGYYKNMTNTSNALLNPDSPMYIVEGIAGNKENGNIALRKTSMPLINFSWVCCFIAEPSGFTAAISIEKGFGMLHVHNATHIQYVHMRTNDTKEIDNFWLVKDYNYSIWSFLLNPAVLLILAVLALAFALMICNMVVLCRKINENKKAKQEEKERKAKKYKMIDNTLSNLHHSAHP